MKSKLKGTTEVMLTTAEAAKALKITPGRVRHLVTAGIIQAEKFGRDLMIPQSEVEKARTRKTKRGPAPAKKGAK